MKLSIVIFSLSVIIFLGFIARFYELGKAPAGLYLDEAGQGYNAYSILKIGKDEYGKYFPVVFRSFTDYKTPIYIYLITPLIPIFGLNAFTVRLPSFIMSLFTFPILYLLLNKLSPTGYKITLPLLATLLLAISPWHVLFGRTNFECNVALFFFILGIYLFYLALKRPVWLIFSSIVFAVSLMAYHSERIITPLIVGLLVYKFRVVLLKRGFRGKLALSVLVSLVILLPTLQLSLTPGFLSRASTLNIFSHKMSKPAGYLENYEGFLAPLVNSPLFLSTKEFLSLYMSYHSPRYMFYLGDYGPRSSFPNLATFYFWQLPFYIIGIYFLIKDKSLKEVRFLTLALLVIAPIPAAVTRDPYSTIRALPLVVPQLIVVSLGMLKAVSFFNTKIKVASAAIFITLIIHSMLNLYSSGVILNEYFRAKYWDYGWEEVVETIKSLEPDIPKIVDNSRGEPYIFLLFYLQYDPTRYQIENYEVDPDDYYTNLSRNSVKKIDAITTKTIDWENDLVIDQYLIGDSLAISEEQIKEHKLASIKEVKYPDRDIAFRVVRTNPEYEKQFKY